MPTSGELPGPPEASVSPHRATRMQAMKAVSIAGLLAAAGLRSHLAFREIAAGFLVTASAMFVMFLALEARRHTIAAWQLCRSEN